jgi:hypothetical protein
VCLDGAGYGLTCRSAGVIMAGCGLAWSRACGRWLPVRLPAASLATLMFEWSGPVTATELRVPRAPPAEPSRLCLVMDPRGTEPANALLRHLARSCPIRQHGGRKASNRVAGGANAWA